MFWVQHPGGHFNPVIDEDGVIRRVPMFYEFEGQYYESLSLAMVREVFGESTVEPVFAEGLASSEEFDYSSVEWLRIGPSLIPVDENIQVLSGTAGRV